MCDNKEDKTKENNIGVDEIINNCNIEQYKQLCEKFKRKRENVKFSTRFWNTTINDIEQITLKSTIEYELEQRIRNNILYKIYLRLVSFKTIYRLERKMSKDHMIQYLFAYNIDAEVMGKIRNTKWFQNKVNTKYEKELKFKISNS